MAVRRPLALAFAALAVVVTLAVLAYGYACGMKRVSAECASAAECDAASECVSAPHPFAPPFVALALLGGVGAWKGRRDLTLAGAVLVAALATLLGFSIGALEIAAAALLVAAGFALPARDRRDRWLAWGALAVLLLAVPIFTLVGFARPPIVLVWLLFFAPALAWLALAGATWRAPGAEPAEAAP